MQVFRKYQILISYRIKHVRTHPGLFAEGVASQVTTNDNEKKYDLGYFGK